MKIKDLIKHLETLDQEKELVILANNYKQYKLWCNSPVLPIRLIQLDGTTAKQLTTQQFNQTKCIHVKTMD